MESQLGCKADSRPYFLDMRFRSASCLLIASMLLMGMLGGPGAVLCVGQEGHVEIASMVNPGAEGTTENCCTATSTPAPRTEEPKDCGDCVDIALELGDGVVQEADPGLEKAKVTALEGVAAGLFFPLQTARQIVRLPGALRPSRPPPVLESLRSVRLLI